MSKSNRRQPAPISVHVPGLAVGIAVAVQQGNIGLAIGLGVVVEALSVVKILAARADLPELIDRVRRAPSGPDG